MQKSKIWHFFRILICCFFVTIFSYTSFDQKFKIWGVSESGRRSLSVDVKKIRNHIWESGENLISITSNFCKNPKFDIFSKCSNFVFFVTIFLYTSFDQKFKVGGVSESGRRSHSVDIKKSLNRTSEGGGNLICVTSNFWFFTFFLKFFQNWRGHNYMKNQHFHEIWKPIMYLGKSLFSKCTIGIKKI